MYVMARLVLDSGMLVAVIPAVLILAVGQWASSRADPSEKSQAWILFWLVCALVLALPFAIFSKDFFSRAAGLFLLMLLPVFEGVLAVLLLNWRQVYKLWQDKKALVSLLFLGLILILASTALMNVYLTGLLTLPALAFALVWAGMRRLVSGWLTFVGLFLALFLVADALGLAGNHLVYSLDRLRMGYKIASGLGALLGLAVAAICLHRLIKDSSQVERGGRVFYLALATLLFLSVAAVTFRHGVLVRATGRAAEDHLPFGAVAAGLIAGLVLVLNAGSRIRLASLGYLILVPIVIVFSFMGGLWIDFQSITEERAARIGQALERYHQENGEYPAGLGALTPDYLPIILGPLSGRGQVWCYQAAPQGYRLGYVFFQRYYEWGDGTPFYEPYYEIKIPRTGGSPPEGSWMCDEELQLYQLHGGL